MSDEEEFADSVRRNAAAMAGDPTIRELSDRWVRETYGYQYSYNFRWLGLPIIQLPQDILAMQQIIWQVRPDLIVETGVARGGSLVFYASMLELIGEDGHALGIDIDVRAHNRKALESHPMSKRIKIIDGSSIDPATVAKVREFARDRKRVLVALDSNHTHEHVLAELRSYAPLVTKGSYLVTFDTVVERLPDELSADRPWGKGNNPKTAVDQFLAENDRFVVDEAIEQRLAITMAPSGYLQCVKD